MRAYVLVRLHRGEDELVRFLRGRPEVKSAEVVYGEYDVVVVAETEDIHELSRLVQEEIRKRFDVERTSTLIVTD